jgi:hypothetical protein
LHSIAVVLNIMAVLRHWQTPRVKPASNFNR